MGIKRALRANSAKKKRIREMASRGARRSKK